LVRARRINVLHNSDLCGVGWDRRRRRRALSLHNVVPFAFFAHLASAQKESCAQHEAEADAPALYTVTRRERRT
jgi:hypothetical protein